MRAIFCLLCLTFLLSPAVGRSDEAPIKNRVTLFQEFSPDVDVAMIGDSITQGGLWNEFILDFQVANRGVGGDMSAGILRRMDSILSTNPEIAFLMVGINDLKQGLKPKAVYRNIRQIVDELRENHIRVILQSTLGCTLPKCDFSLNQKVRQLNIMLLDFAKRDGVEYLDLNATMSREDGLIPDYTFDGIHLNGKGYKAWVKAMRPLLDKSVQ